MRGIKETVKLIGKAILNDDFQTLRKLLAKVHPDDPQFDFYELPLLFAIEAGSPEALRIVLEAGADPNGRGLALETLLSRQTYAKLEKAKLLLQYGLSSEKSLDKENVVKLLLENALKNPLFPGETDVWYYLTWRFALEKEEVFQMMKDELIEVARGGRGRGVITAKRIGELVQDIARFAHGVDLWDALGRDLVAVSGEEGKEWEKGLLIRATYFNRWDILEKLSQEGADLKIRMEDKRNLIHMWADTANYGNQADDAKKTLRLLVSAGVSVNDQDREGNTPLHYASRLRKGYEKIEMLLQEGADPDIPNRNGITPIFLLPREDAEGLQLLLSYGANPNVKDKNGVTPLIHYASMEMLSEFREAHLQFLMVLLRAGADPKGGSPTDHTVLTAVLERRFAGTLSNDFPQELLYDFVREALKRGTDPDAQDVWGRTPLHYAVKDLQLVRILLEAKANPNIPSEDGETPIHYVRPWDKEAFEVLSMLVEAGAEVNLKTQQGHSLAFYWIRDLITPSSLYPTPSDVLGALRRLVDLGVDFKDEKAILHLFEGQGGSSEEQTQRIVQILKFLLDDVGVPLSFRDQNGNTFLHLAIKSGNPDLVDFFLGLGIEPTIANFNGETPGDILVEKIQRREGEKIKFPDWAIDLGILPLKNEKALLDVLTDEERISRSFERVKKFVLRVFKENPMTALTLFPILTNLPKDHPTREIIKEVVEKGGRKVLNDLDGALR